MEGTYQRLLHQDRQRGYLGLDLAGVKRAIAAVDPENKLAPFNDWVQEKHAPPRPNAARNLVLEDVVIDGKTCDVYHWDQEDGRKIQDSSYNRIFIHIKE